MAEAATVVACRVAALACTVVVAPAADCWCLSAEIKFESLLLEERPAVTPTAAAIGISAITSASTTPREPLNCDERRAAGPAFERREVALA